MEAQRRAAPPALFAPIDDAGAERRARPGPQQDGAAAPIFRLALTARNVALLLAALLALALAIAWIGYLSIAPKRGGVFMAEPQRMPPRGWVEDAERRAAAIVNEPLPSIVPHAKRPAAMASATLGAMTPAPGKPASPASSGAASRTAAASQSGGQPVLHASVMMKPGAPTRAAPPPLPSPAMLEPGAEVPSTAAIALRDGGELEACGQLRPQEAALCRVRVCRARWQHEAGCRTASAVDSE